MRKAIINRATGLVVNVIELEARASWTPPDGHEVRSAGKAGPGWSWNGQRFLPPVPLAPTRQDELRDKVIEGTVSLDEWQEIWRAERGLQERYETRQAEIAAGR